MSCTLPAAIVAMLAAPASAPIAPQAPPPGEEATPDAAATPTDAVEPVADPPAPAQAPPPHEAEPPTTPEPPPAQPTAAETFDAEPPPTLLPDHTTGPDPLSDASSSRIPKKATFNGRALWIGGAAATGTIFVTQLLAHGLLRSSCAKETDDLVTGAAACAGDLALYVSLRTAGMVAYQSGIALMATGGAFSGRARAIDQARGEADPLPAQRRPLGIGLAIGGGVGAIVSVLAWSGSISACDTDTCVYRADLLTTVTLGASIASVSTGAMFWAQSSAYARKARELSLSPSAHRRGGGLSLRGRF